MENRFVIADEYIITLIVPAKPMNSWACCAKRIAWRAIESFCDEYEMTVNHFIARSKTAAVRYLRRHRGIVLELDYASAWRDTAELGRLGLECDVRVVSRGVDNIVVTSFSVLEMRLRRTKLTYRQRNLFCCFTWNSVPNEILSNIMHLASINGDRLLNIEQLPGSPNETWD